MEPSYKDYINKPIDSSYFNKNITLKDIAACRGQSNSFFVRALNNVKLFFQGKIVDDKTIARILENNDKISDISNKLQDITNNPTNEIKTNKELKQIKNDIKIAKDLAKIFKISTSTSTQPNENLAASLQKTQDNIQGQIELKKYDPADILKAHLYNQTAEVKESMIAKDFIDFLASKANFPGNSAELKNAYNEFIAKAVKDGNAGKYKTDKPVEFYFMALKAGNPHATKFTKIEISEVLENHPLSALHSITQGIQRLLGNQKMTDFEHSVLKDLLLNPETNQEFTEFLKNQFSGVGREGLNNGTTFLINLVKDAIQLRERQLELHASRQDMLGINDKQAKTIVSDFFLIQNFLSSKHLKEKEDVVRFIQTSTENAIPINMQIVSDKVYPDVAFYLTEKEIADLKNADEVALNKLTKIGDNILTPKIGGTWPQVRLAKNLHASKIKEGITKGFINRNNSDIHERNEWNNVDVSKDGVFLSGDFQITFLNSEGQKTEASASLDLSTLGNLTRDQVFSVFKMIEVACKSNDSIEEIILKNSQSLNVDKELLYSIIKNFSNKINNDVTFAILMVNHIKNQEMQT